MPGADEAMIMCRPSPSVKHRPTRNGGSAYASTRVVLPARTAKRSSSRAARPTSAALRMSVPEPWVQGPGPRATSVPVKEQFPFGPRHDVFEALAGLEVGEDERAIAPPCLGVPCHHIQA